MNALTKGAAKALRARIALFRGGYSLHKDATMKRALIILHLLPDCKDECNDIIGSGQHNLNPQFPGALEKTRYAHTP